MLISDLIRDLARVLAQHGDRVVLARSRAAVELSPGEVFAVDAYPVGRGLVQVPERGWLAAFRPKRGTIPPQAPLEDCVCFGSTQDLPRGVAWHHPDALRDFTGPAEALWVSPAFVRLVRTTAGTLRGPLTEATLHRALDPEDEDPRMLQEVAAAVAILVDCGVLRREGKRLKRVRQQPAAS